MKEGKGNILELSFSFTEYYKKQTYLGFKDTNKIYIYHLFLHSTLIVCDMPGSLVGASDSTVNKSNMVTAAMEFTFYSGKET